MNVTKTLIIGLGSTGTRIADSVATRVRWELGALEKAPWMRFLCIETNVSEKAKLDTLQDTDFRDLAIGADDFSLLVQQPQMYDQAIGLSSWIHKETVTKLPGQDVTSGVGNIRMLGRLAFLFPDNFEKIHLAVTGRLANLRELTENEARLRRGPLASGEDPEISFSNGDRIRIVVAGTLCGGTCSGLASDFGYFLQTITQEDDQASAIFTLPNQNLTSADVRHAERFKKNAYHALVELNHYHLSGRGDEAKIRFPNGTHPNTQKFPYDLTYLVMPRGTDSSSEKQLNKACADRIFVDVFVPETESFADAVNATVFGVGESISDRDHRAHVFSTFGLSTVEFPAQQVTEAATKKLLAYTLKTWHNRTIEDPTPKVDALGFTWDGIKEVALNKAMDGQLLETVTSRRNGIERTVGQDPDNAREALSKLRSALHGGGDFDVPHELQKVQNAVAEVFLRRIRDYAREALGDFQRGPQPTREVLQAIRTRLNELKLASAPSYSAAQTRVEESFDVIDGYRNSRLLAMVGLRNQAIKSQLPNLRRAIEEELDKRLDRALLSILVGDTHSGLLDRIDRQIGPIQMRIEGLRTRTTSFVNQATRSADELSASAPDINGVAIFQSGGATAGTVQIEYERCIQEFVNDPAMSFEECRDRLASNILQSWTAMADAALPGEQPERDLFLEPIRSGHPPFPGELGKTLEQAAVEPFRRLSQTDVLERWMQTEAAVNQHLDKAKEAASRSKPFLDVNNALATRGGRSPIPTRNFVLLPNSSHADTFVEAVKGKMGNPTTGSSPEMFRIVMLQEKFRFPLSGCIAILSETNDNALENAEAKDFPYFWTRTDVGWTGISDAEIERARRAEEVLSAAILIGDAEPRQGGIEIRWEGGLMGSPTRKLPLEFNQAAQKLAREERDIDGKPMTNALEFLDLRVKKYIRDLQGDEREQSLKFVKQIADRLNSGRGQQITNWDHNQVWSIMKRYFAKRDSLYAALTELEPLDEGLLSSLWREAGAPDPHGGFYERSGYYCPAPNCGGLLGYTKQEAAKNGWRCYIRPDEHNLDNLFGQA